MEKDNPTDASIHSEGDSDIETQHLIATHNDLEQEKTRIVKKPDGIFERQIERLNIKKLISVWGPRFEFFVRLMLVSTFLDDSFRTMTEFTASTQQIGELECLKWLAAISPVFVSIIATIALSIGLIAQFAGSLCLLALVQTDIATKALICWTIAQPMLNAQLLNLELVTDSLSLVGGLLMLRAHLVFGQARSDAGSRVQFIGRLLLPVTYLYRAGQFLMSAFTLDETNSIFMFISSLSMFFVYSALVVVMVVSTLFVAAGLKSRVVALLLALINLAFICYQHPFFRYVWMENGEWKYDEVNMGMPNVSLSADIGIGDFELWQIYDLHRYYFFLGLSTSGALLLLAQFGPGDIAVQKDEIVLPVRAED